tara:strand:+ start:64 stop:552 length:489 start_codon:yes stop_codon:yes gene_type:complete
MKTGDKLSISDSVITGDVTNIIQSNRVVCESCGAEGNLVIFTCSELDCSNMFCEYCKNEDMPQKCKSCIFKLEEALKSTNLLSESSKSFTAESFDSETMFDFDEKMNIFDSTPRRENLVPYAGNERKKGEGETDEWGEEDWYTLIFLGVVLVGGIYIWKYLL